MAASATVPQLAQVGQLGELSLQQLRVREGQVVASQPAPCVRFLCKSRAPACELPWRRTCLPANQAYTSKVRSLRRKASTASDTGSGLVSSAGGADAASGTVATADAASGTGAAAEAVSGAGAPADAMAAVRRRVCTAPQGQQPTAVHSAGRSRAHSAVISSRDRNDRRSRPDDGSLFSTAPQPTQTQTRHFFSSLRRPWSRTPAFRVGRR